MHSMSLIFGSHGRKIWLKVAMVYATHLLEYGLAVLINLELYKMGYYESVYVLCN